uniref:Uncharacterized protein n=1 Tax=Knipowitschia caucasica TaxID=637954 RepID=A0AAV2LPZ2_KNICA
MARITLSCVPASWYCSVSLLSLGCVPRQRLVFLLLLLCSALLLLLLWSPPRRPNTQPNKHLSVAESLEATDVQNQALNYGVVVDCGSSGSRVFVYYWPPHNGNPHTLLDIRQMRDRDRKPVVLKIKPGISTLAKTPTAASDYLQPLLGFAAAHVPKTKHKETPLYILCTAGMRLLPDSEQAAILEDIVSDVPLEFDFLFSESHAEVISGKQEGVYAWIGINFVLGRFDHADVDDATVEVTTSSQSRQPISRRRTVGIMDMGGASLQIAYEVPGVVHYSSPQESDGGLSVLRTFRLLRVLKLVRFMPALRRQLVVLMKTMDNVATFCMLLMLFIFIFSILGMHIFGCKFSLKTETGDTVPDRKNFDSLLWAIVTVFQILTQEDWNVVLYNGMAATSPLAALYFVALMTFGNYVLFNLLVAILVEGFQAEVSAR